VGSGGAFLDRLRIEQALGNLVENALRYGAGTVRVTASQQGDELELQVTDKGSGFPPEFARHAFERFSRAEPSRSGGCAGLGLAIVAAVATAHGGSATVTSAPGGGGRVSIRVPSSTLGTRTSDARVLVSPP